MLQNNYMQSGTLVSFTLCFQKCLACSLLTLLCLPVPAIAANENSVDDLFSMSLEELLNQEVVTASLQAEKLSDAVATTYVITGEQIKAIGARTIYDALVLIPGLTLSGNKGGAKKLFWRGVGSRFSSQYMFLLDNHVLNGSVSGGVTANFLDKVAIGNIDRIEVVHGAGSSLYGGNAFLGMINIITRKGGEVDGIEGSIKTEYDHSGHAMNYYDLLFGKKYDNGWQTSLNFHALNGNGVERWEDRDRLGRSGAVDSEEKVYSIDLQLANETFSLHGNYLSNESGGFFGAVHVLNDGTVFETNHGFIDAEWTIHSGPDFDIRLLGGMDQWKMGWHYELIPAGVPPYPQVTSSAGYDGLTYQSELRGTYTGLSNHSIISGLSLKYEKVQAPYLLQNGTVNPGNWIDPMHRNIWAIYLNDNYKVTETVAATLSARYDHYSDFGGSLNPRLGLSWQLTPDYKIKALAGTAFRAPDFAAQGARNNSLVISTPDLEPEQITTWEIGINATPRHDLLLQATLFHYDIDDLISQSVTLPQKWENTDSLTSQGIEMAIRYELNRHMQLSASYTFADLDHDQNYPQPSVPPHSGSVTMDYRFNEKLRLNLNGFGQGNVERIAGDSRDDMDGYVILNTTLEAALTKHLTLQLSVFNLTDEDYGYASYPATGPTPPFPPTPYIPNDFTAPCRSFLLGLSFNF